MDDWKSRDDEMILLFVFTLDDIEFVFLGIQDSRTEILILIFVKNFYFWEYKSLAPMIGAEWSHFWFPVLGRRNRRILLVLISFLNWRFWE